MQKILFAYATQKGSTAEVADFMAKQLREDGFDVTLVNVAESSPSVTSFDAFIFGTPIYKGVWMPEMIKYIHTNLGDLGDKPVFGWVTCIRVLEVGGYDHVMSNYMEETLLDRMNLQGMKVLAGRLILEHVDWEERWTLALHYDGRVAPDNYDADFRDWEVIRAWTSKISHDLHDILTN